MKTSAVGWMGLGFWAALSLGCGDGGSEASGGAASQSSNASTGAGGSPAGSGGSPGSGGSGNEPITLVSTDWTVPSGTEVYECTRLTVEEDFFITQFRPVMPLGVHHLVLSIDDGTKPDGTVVCPDPFEVGAQQIYAAGLGAETLVFPAGVAAKVTKGQQLHLNVHLFNTGGAPMSGSTAIEVVTVAEEAVVHRAEAHIWGKDDGLTIPPNTEGWTQTKTCVIPQGLSQPTLFGVAPHMHQLGRKLTLSLTPEGGAPNEFFTEDNYSFDEQLVELVDEHLNAGDQLTITCTYDNPTPNTVEFGESTNDEMCFGLLWTYPSGAAFCN